MSSNIKFVIGKYEQNIAAVKNLMSTTFATKILRLTCVIFLRPEGPDFDSMGAIKIKSNQPHPFYKFSRMISES